MAATDRARREGHFEGAGGVEIFWRAWIAPETPRATAVLAHGASEHSGRYAHVAAAMNERGYSLWALDHQGHGRSGGDRAVIERLEYSIEDLDRLVVMAAEELPGQQPYLLGHSMGGMLATAYTIRHEERLAGLILSGPVAVLETASAVQRGLSHVLSRVAPTLGVYTIDSQGVSRDPDVVRDYDSDPFNHHGKMPVRTVAEMANEVDTFPLSARAISIPILIMHGGSDPIVPVAGSQLLHERVSSEDKTLTIYDGLYHEILNEPEQDDVIAEICAWLDARTEPVTA
jgi:alpha-beta hydrolase superfamily lysophospholipase